MSPAYFIPNPENQNDAFQAINYKYSISRATWYCLGITYK